MNNQIDIPEKYWLKVENFDIYKFTDDDFRLLSISPNILLDDFKNFFPDFEIKKNSVLKRKNKKYKKIDTPIIKKNNLPPINKPYIINEKKSLKEKIDYSGPLDIINKILPNKFKKESLPEIHYIIRD